MAVLPYDAEVEYLESTAAGRERVDTGFIPSSVTDVLTVDAAYTSAGNAFGCLFGVTSRVGGNQRYYQINKTTTSDQFRLITSTGDVFWTKTPEFSGSRHTYVLNKNVLYIDGTQMITGSGTSAQSAKLYLFARNNAATASVDTCQAAWRIYSAKLERNGVVQFDLLPVRVGSVGYFYDKVSGTLLPSGGDPLVVGPDRAKPLAGGTMMIAARESFAIHPSVKEDLKLMMQVTVTAAQTNAVSATTHILNLAIAAGIGGGQYVVKFHTSTLRNNALAAMFINRKTVPNGNNGALRYRNGSLVVIPVTTAYDIAMHVGDVYDVFVTAQKEGWE